MRFPSKEEKGWRKGLGSISGLTTQALKVVAALDTQKRRNHERIDGVLFLDQKVICLNESNSGY